MGTLGDNQSGQGGESQRISGVRHSARSCSGAPSRMTERLSCSSGRREVRGLRGGPGAPGETAALPQAAAGAAVAPG